MTIVLETLTVPLGAESIALFARVGGIYTKRLMLELICG
jgi:Na+/H+-translocating membrane pyrophosphatase